MKGKARLRFTVTVSIQEVKLLLDKYIVNGAP